MAGGARVRIAIQRTRGTHLLLPRLIKHQYEYWFHLFCLCDPQRHKLLPSKRKCGRENASSYHEFASTKMANHSQRDCCEVNIKSMADTEENNERRSNIVACGWWRCALCRDARTMSRHCATSGSPLAQWMLLRCVSMGVHID